MFISVCFLSVLIDVLLVVGTIVAAYCQETTEATRTRSQKQQKKKKTETIYYNYQ